MENHPLRKETNRADYKNVDTSNSQEPATDMAIWTVADCCVVVFGATTLRAVTNVPAFGAKRLRTEAILRRVP
jgi:hypothetical protein